MLDVAKFRSDIQTAGTLAECVAVAKEWLQAKADDKADRRAIGVVIADATKEQARLRSVSDHDIANVHELIESKLAKKAVQEG